MANIVFAAPTSTKSGSKKLRAPKVRNVKVSSLRPEFENLQAWLDASRRNIYIGREMSFYVAGAKGSKWKNPFPVKKFGREGCLDKYEEMVRNGDLWDDLEELSGKTLGCWCHPEPCHGHILRRLFKEKFTSD